MGPFLVVSHGNSLHSKHNLTPLVYAQLQIWQNLFSLATQPAGPAGQMFFCIFGHFSHAIPQTPIFIVVTKLKILHWGLINNLSPKSPIYFR